MVRDPLLEFEGLVSKVILPAVVSPMVGYGIATVVCVALLVGAVALGIWAMTQ